MMDNLIAVTDLMKAMRHALVCLNLSDLLLCEVVIGSMHCSHLYPSRSVLSITSFPIAVCLVACGLFVSIT